MARPLEPKTPFYRFNSSPEIIRLVVMSAKLPLSLRKVADLLHKRGDRRLPGDGAVPVDLEEVYVKIDGETHYRGAPSIRTARRRNRLSPRSGTRPRR